MKGEVIPNKWFDRYDYLRQSGDDVRYVRYLP